MIDSNFMKLGTMYILKIMLSFSISTPKEPMKSDS